MRASPGDGAAVQRVQSATGPQQHRALLLVSPGPRAEAFLTGTRGRTGSRSPREPVSTESRAGGQGHVGPLLPGRSPEPQRALGVTGASPPRGDGGGTGALDRPPTPARPPRPDPRETRAPCWWPGQHQGSPGAPRIPFPGTERCPPRGCPSVPPPAALPASAGPPLNSQPAAPLLERRPLTRRFSGSGSLPQVLDRSCAKGLMSIPRLPASSTPARAYPRLPHPNTRPHPRSQQSAMENGLGWAQSL